MTSIDPAAEQGIAPVQRSRASLVRVAAATTIGSAIEAFDFLVYGTAAALVFSKLFFPTFDAAAATLAAFGTFASGFFARPIGGLIFGHFGDRLGRKAMLTLSLLLMGASTVLIGALPTYASAGIWAPILLVTLRLIQGFSLGGELAGAMLMAVEHAPTGRRTLFGSLPQAGVPMGLLLSTGAFAIASTLPEQDFFTWGWRVPFLASAVLILVGLFIRHRVDESPAFVAVKIARKTSAFPAREVIRRHFRPLLLTIGGKLAEVTLYFTVVVFSISYAVSALGFARGDVLRAVMIGAACQIVSIPFFGWLGDKIGSRNLYAAGCLLTALMAVPLFLAIGSGSLVAFTVAVPVALALNYACMFAPQSALYGSQFPSQLRYTGMSLGIQIAAAIGGGLAPIVAASLAGAYGSLVPVSIYLTVLALLAAICTVLMRAPADEHGEAPFFSERADDVVRRVDQQMQSTLAASNFSLPEKVALACRILAQEGHGRSLAGQVTARAGNDETFWSTNFKVGLAEARVSNLLRIDPAMSVVEGAGMANPAVRFHLWIYQALPQAGSIVHTHPPYASALSMGSEALAVAHMDAMVFYEDCAWLREWPGVPLANEEGRIICEALGRNHAILLAHHGLLTIGQTLEEAVYRAVLFEQAAQIQILARSIGEIRAVKPELGRVARDFLLKQSFVNATFGYWARRAAERAPDALA